MRMWKGNGISTTLGLLFSPKGLEILQQERKGQMDASRTFSSTSLDLLTSSILINQSINQSISIHLPPICYPDRIGPRGGFKHCAHSPFSYFHLLWLRQLKFQHQLGDLMFWSHVLLNRLDDRPSLSADNWTWVLQSVGNSWTSVY